MAAKKVNFYSNISITFLENAITFIYTGRNIIFVYIKDCNIATLHRASEDARNARSVTRALVN